MALCLLLGIIVVGRVSRMCRLVAQSFWGDALYAGSRSQVDGLLHQSDGRTSSRRVANVIREECLLQLEPILRRAAI